MDETDIIALLKTVRLLAEVEYHKGVAQENVPTAWAD